MEQAAATTIPVCNRCHDLLHHSKGTSIAHPSMHSIRTIIEDSPHKHNHIYHVLDAADFPMSLIPNLQYALRLPDLRGRNRRSKSTRYVRGRLAEVSFVITRSDLLAPKKEQVDRLLPYLREVLRDALGSSGKDVRLGNVRCVSAKRGWWTSSVKEEIWERGGAGWMVGKVNVGKSALFEGVFPKGRQKPQLPNHQPLHQTQHQKQEQTRKSEPENTEFGNSGAKEKAAHDCSGAEAAVVSAELQPHVEPDLASSPLSTGEVETSSTTRNELRVDENFLNEDIDDSLLPPLQKEAAYPQMPLVSSLPGTTSSPIRIPFGHGRGELIDLPGIERSSLAEHVEPQYHPDLLMKSRMKPEQHTIKPGQSLLVGGMFRITPKDSDLVMLAYPFIPLSVHVTSTSKAIAIQTGFDPAGELYAGNVQSISTTQAKARIRQAGMYKLEHDVTKHRTGPLTNPVAGKQKASNLPFIVYSTDILFEGLGWVELVCQVRKSRQTLLSGPLMDTFGEEQSYTPEFASQSDKLPEFEVWSPDGEFVGTRRPMNAWVVNGPRHIAANRRHGRPRQTISMQRRRDGGAKKP